MVQLPHAAVYRNPRCNRFMDHGQVWALFGSSSNQILINLKELNECLQRRIKLAQPWRHWCYAPHFTNPMIMPHPDRTIPPDLFMIAWPYLEQALQTERTDRELADYFAIELAQVRAWLQRATNEQLVKRLNKPVR